MQGAHPRTRIPCEEHDRCERPPHLVLPCCTPCRDSAPRPPLATYFEQCLFLERHHPVKQVRDGRCHLSSGLTIQAHCRAINHERDVEQGPHQGGRPAISSARSCCRLGVARPIYPRLLSRTVPTWPRATRAATSPHRGATPLSQPNEPEARRIFEAAACYPIVARRHLLCDTGRWQGKNQYFSG